MRAYSDDYAGWVEDTARAIEAGRFSEIDRAALADEVRDLGKTERRELRSALEVLIMHMLKIRYQPEGKTRSWELTMRVRRDDIGEFLEESPCLRGELPTLLASAYRKARLKAAGETGLDVGSFPELCEWTLAECSGPSAFSPPTVSQRQERRASREGIAARVYATASQRSNHSKASTCILRSNLCGPS